VFNILALLLTETLFNISEVHLPFSIALSLGHCHVVVGLFGWWSSVGYYLQDYF